MSYVNADQLALPTLRFDISSGSSTFFQTSGCGTQGGKIVDLVPCGGIGSPQSCLQTASLAVATPTDNKLTCILAGNISPDPTFMVRISSPDNPPGRYFSTFVKSTDGVSIFVDRVQFTSGKDVITTHTLTPEYYSAAAQQGAVNIEFVVPTFSTFNWIRWKPFSGWDAYGTLGGILFFSYIFHGLLMKIASIWLENPWELQRTMAKDARELQPLTASSPSSKRVYSEMPDPSARAEEL